MLLFCKIVEFRELRGVAFKNGLFSESEILTEALLAPNLDGSESLLMESLDLDTDDDFIALDSFAISFCTAGSL